MIPRPSSHRSLMDAVTVFVYRCQHCGAERERDAAEARMFGPPRCPEACQTRPNSEGDYAPTMTKTDEWNQSYRSFSDE